MNIEGRKYFLGIKTDPEVEARLTREFDFVLGAPVEMDLVVMPDEVGRGARRTACYYFSRRIPEYEPAMERVSKILKSWNISAESVVFGPKPAEKAEEG